MNLFEILVLVGLFLFLTEHAIMSIYLLRRNRIADRLRASELEAWERSQQKNRLQEQNNTLTWEKLTENLVASNDANMRAARELQVILQEFLKTK